MHSAAEAMHKNRRSSLLGSLARIAILVSIATAALTATFGYLWLRDLRVFNLDPQQLNVIVRSRSNDNTLIYDREGQKIGEVFASYHVFVPFKQLPKDLVDAIVATEDRNFWQHPGYDAKGILRAAVAHVKGRSLTQGASTITQQLVRNFLLNREKSLERKVKEIALAIQLEKRLKKERIFEIYANSLFLGNGSYGVGAAAYRYFGKKVSDLNTEECALIAGLFQSPSRYNPVRFPKRAKARQVQVLNAMQQAGFLTSERVRELSKKPLAYKEYRPVNETVAPYFIDYVREQAKQILGDKPALGNGLRIYTTLDSSLQKLAEEALEASEAKLKSAQDRATEVHSGDNSPRKATLEAALLSVDPASGAILTMVGGRDYQRSKFNRTYQALRSPGSAFKPVVYSLALSKHWKWSDVIYVSPITIDNYRPRTPDEDYLTETTLFRAFYRSMNTPTIELGQKLGLKAVLEQAKTLGIRSPLKEEFGSLLGSSEVTMMDLARMYGAFANGGKVIDPIAITKITDRRGHVIFKANEPAERASEALSPAVAFLMNQGMRAVLQVGTGYSSAHLASVAAGKTGTANDSTDNWFCGFSPNLATIVWVGTDEHAEIRGDTTGAKLALPIWDTFMTNAFAVRQPEPFQVPPDIVQATVHPRYGNLSASGVKMYFIRGNEPSEQPSALEALSKRDGATYRDVFTH